MAVFHNFIGGLGSSTATDHSNKWIFLTWHLKVCIMPAVPTSQIHYDLGSLEESRCVFEQHTTNGTWVSTTFVITGSKRKMRGDLNGFPKHSEKKLIDENPHRSHMEYWSSGQESSFCMV